MSVLFNFIESVLIAFNLAVFAGLWTGQRTKIENHSIPKSNRPFFKKPDHRKINIFKEFLSRFLIYWLFLLIYFIFSLFPEFFFKFKEILFSLEIILIVLVLYWFSRKRYFLKNILKLILLFYLFIFLFGREKINLPAFSFFKYNITEILIPSLTIFSLHNPIIFLIILILQLADFNVIKFKKHFFFILIIISTLKIFIGEILLDEKNFIMEHGSSELVRVTQVFRLDAESARKKDKIINYKISLFPVSFANVFVGFGIVDIIEEDESGIYMARSFTIDSIFSGSFPAVVYYKYMPEPIIPLASNARQFFKTLISISDFPVIESFSDTDENGRGVDHLKKVVIFDLSRRFLNRYFTVTAMEGSFKITGPLF